MIFRILLWCCVFLATYTAVTVADSDERATYRFTACGSRGREGPTMMECTQHYCNNGSLVCGHLLDEGTRGSQMFVVPRSGNYTVTIAGANGGHGVCSNYSGLGVIARNTVKFRRGERLRILVGQQGVSVCDGHQDVDVCHLADDRVACENYWYSETEYNHDVYLYDGGGGGGGASLLEYPSFSSPIAIAPGGGGAGAIYNLTSFLFIVNDSRTYSQYANADPFKTLSDVANGTTGFNDFIDTAGPGAGYYLTEYVAALTDPDILSGNAFGGKDCSENLRLYILFPDTHGGFGGGGGGCNGGGGGGGYTGGSITLFGETIPGEGGYSWPDPPWPLIGYNDGDGYVELFLESCGCTYYCNMSNESSFECSCPPDTSLAPNGLDCYKEEYYLGENDILPVRSVSFSHPIFGEVTATITSFEDTIFAYSTTVMFSNNSFSDRCAVLFVDSVGRLIATTKFVNRSSEIQFLNLFTANTAITQNGNISANLSTGNMFIVQEPLYVTFVVTIGIKGDCILDELIVNTSIDEIIAYDFSGFIDITSTAVLSTYLDLFLPTSSDNSQLSTVVMAVIIASAIVLVVVIVAMILCIVFSWHRKHSHGLITLGSYIEYDEQQADKINDSMRLLNGYTVEERCTRENSTLFHQYEQLHPTYENVQDGIELPISHKSMKYGLQSPLHDYYLYNCSRQNDGWRYDRTKLTYMREIGEGQFGKVLLMSAKDICDIQGSLVVAVKTLTSRNPKDIELFSKELDLMKRFIHPNIVSLLGHCEATSDSAPMMILELMQYGDLKWFLEENRPNKVNTSVVTVAVSLSIISDIASALEYLATNKYVHRDVAARNCLIGKNFKAKLADFGLARGVHEKDYYKIAAQTLLPVRWLAPESLLYGRFSSASDVWSYGVLVWEVATFGETPHEQLPTSNIVEMASDGSLRLDSPPGCPEVLTDLISQCTRIQSGERPTFTEILEYCSSKHDSDL